MTNSNMYPRVGKNAPLSVRKAIRHFRKMSDKFRASKPLLYWILGSGTPPYKMNKKDSNYVSKSKKKYQTCGNCEHAFEHLKSGKKICSQIDGYIVTPGWCRLWET